VLIEIDDSLGFRHELAREAVEQSLSAVRRRQLHGRALRASPSGPRRTIALSRITPWAAATKRPRWRTRSPPPRRPRTAAPREAAEHYGLAVRHSSGAAERAALFVALSYSAT
jgi:hypothetical protein